MAATRPAPRARSLTTLQAARALADAVLAAPRRRQRDSNRDGATQAVFAVLERAGLWFMRVEDSGDGALRPVQALDERGGICRWCGCTDLEPCEVEGLEICRWVNRARTLCSACVGIERLLHTAGGRLELLTACSTLSARIAATPKRREPYRRKTGKR